MLDKYEKLARSWQGRFFVKKDLTNLLKFGIMALEIEKEFRNDRKMNRQRIIYNLKKKSKVFSFLYNVAPMFLLICFWLLLFNFFGFFDYINNFNR